MAIVSVNGRAFDVDAVVFDKDDTLVDLNATWGPVARTWITALAGSDPAIEQLLADRLGYDAANRRVVPDSVMATHTLPEIGAQTRSLLAGSGLDDHTIGERIEQARRAIEAEVYGLPLEPLTDLVGVFTGLRAAGLSIAIFTSDNDQPTRHFLSSCGLSELVDAVITGEVLDRPKPHGDGLRAVARLLTTTPDRMLMVGDSLHDHGSAREAGSWFVAVGHDSAAARLADASVADVSEIRVS